MSACELLTSPATAPAASPGDGSVEGRALSPDVACPVVVAVGATLGISTEVPHDPLTPTTPASSDSARGFGFTADDATMGQLWLEEAHARWACFDLSVMLYGGSR